MLVLSRKQGETIQVGDDITLTVVRIGPNSVRLGVEAPSEKRIVRSELLEESAGHGSKHDASRMDGEGQGGPFVYDCDPPLLVGKHAL